jgi:hypothetical protein
MIFKDKIIPVGQAAHKMRIYFQGSWKPPSINAQRVIREVQINQEFALGYFNGDSQGTPGICGAGALLFSILVIISTGNYVLMVTIIELSSMLFGCFRTCSRQRIGKAPSLGRFQDDHRLGQWEL